MEWNPTDPIVNLTWSTLHIVPEIDNDQPRYMKLMHNETLLDFCHKTWLTYCKRFNTENDLFE